MSETATMLTPRQATTDALAALRAAGFGKERKRPVTASSWRSGRDNFGLGPEQITTQVTVRRADLDDALRTLIVLPQTVTYSHTATVVTIHRDVTPIRHPAYLEAGR
jgi:hypothetical protein